LKKKIEKKNNLEPSTANLKKCGKWAVQFFNTFFFDFRKRNCNVIVDFCFLLSDSISKSIWATFSLGVFRARDLLAVARISVTHLHAHHDRFKTRQSQQQRELKKKTRERKKNLLPKINRETKCCIGNPFYPRGIQARLPSSIRIVIEDG
jgi:hypothetical protein